MTPAEKHLLSLYLVNQGLRLDMELSQARLAFDMKPDCNHCMTLLDKQIGKDYFDKFQHDLCALLKI